MTMTGKPKPEAVHLQCREIWGGIAATDTGISVPGIDAWLFSRPYRDSPGGGDIHYVGLCGRGMMSRFVIADVSGHGSLVADLAEKLRALMTQYMNTPDQTELVKGLNAQFASLGEVGKFATAIVMTYLAGNSHLVTVNAGHPHPLWYRRSEDQWHLLEHKLSESESGLMDLPLGIVPETGYRQFAVHLEEGDLLLLYTDSLIEAVDATGRQIGEGGLMEIARRIGPDEPGRFTRCLIDAVARASRTRQFDDDVTILALYHTGQGGAGE